MGVEGNKSTVILQIDAFCPEKSALPHSSSASQNSARQSHFNLTQGFSLYPCCGYYCAADDISAF